MNWSVVDEPSFLHSAKLLGDPKDIDDALLMVDYALWRNPLGLHLIPGFKHVRIAKTKVRIVGMRFVPAYRVWVRVEEETHCVSKLWVELCPVASMPYGETFNDDDPF